MQAILLAGGLGTRFRSVVSGRPKSVALIEEEPFTEYATRELIRYGITDIVFAVGYKGTMVEKHFGDGAAFGFHTGRAHEETLLGTAGAIRDAGRFITEDRSYVPNADAFYQIDYTRPLRQQDSQNLDMVLVLHRVSDASWHGQVILDRDGLLTGSNGKTEDAREGTISGGTYPMKQRLLDEIPEGKVSLENDTIPKWLSEGRRLGGFINDGYFIDIGILEAYFQFQEDMRNEVVI